MISLSYRNRYLTFYNFKLYNLVSYKHFKDFKKQPYLYLDKNLFKQFQEMPSQITYENLQEKGIKPIQDGYDVVELSNKVFAQGRKNLLVEYKKKFYLFNNVKNLQTFMKTPHLFAEVKLPEKYLGQKQESTNKNKRNNNKDSSSSYLENNLSNIVMKVLANLGFKTKILIKNIIFLFRL